MRQTYADGKHWPGSLAARQGQMQGEARGSCYSWSHVPLAKRMNGPSLESILTTDVVTCGADDALGDVLLIMARRRISCVVAMDGERRPCGIFTERDAVGLLAAEVVSPTRPIREVMSRPVVALPVSADARARIADPESGALAASGKAGELQVRGPSLFIGYLGDEAATRRAFTPDGWFRTGDIGIGLDDGGFTLLGRMGDTLRLGGYLVNPLEIEQVVAEDPSVAACQAVERNRRDGTRVIAFVVLAPGAALDEPALLARCRAKLAGYKVPARIVALDRFPTTDGPNGTKVRRAELRAMAAALR